MSATGNLSIMVRVALVLLYFIVSTANKGKVAVNLNLSLFTTYGSITKKEQRKQQIRIQLM